MYDPYGNVTFLKADWSLQEVSGHADGTASAYDNPILFAGYYRDSETGLYHVRNRMYHAQLGLWLQRDPLGYVDGMSLYGYVGSNPAGLRDAMGLCADSPKKIIEDLKNGTIDSMSELKNRIDGLTMDQKMELRGQLAQMQRDSSRGSSGNRGGGGGDWDWAKGLRLSGLDGELESLLSGLAEDRKRGWQDYASERQYLSGRDAAILQRFNQDLLDGADPSIAWARAEMTRARGWESLPSYAESAVMLTDGVGSGSYLAVGSLVVGAPALAKAAVPHAAHATAWAAAKATTVYSAAAAKAATAAPAAASLATRVAESGGGQFFVGVSEGYTPGPPPEARNPYHGAGVLIGQTLEDVTIPSAHYTYETVRDWLE